LRESKCSACMSVLRRRRKTKTMTHSSCRWKHVAAPHMNAKEKSNRMTGAGKEVKWLRA
jgi:hypothetical protein